MQAIIRGIVSRMLPQGALDNTSSGQSVRMGRYQEIDVLNVVPTKHSLADEGAYFVGQQVATAYGVVTTFSDTQAAIVIQNNGSITDPLAKRFYLDYIRFIPTVAPASATQAFYAVKLDNVNRVPSAGASAALAPVSSNMDYGGTSVCRAWFFSGGVMTVPASGSSSRIITPQASLKPFIPNVGDELVIVSGAVDLNGQSAVTAAGGRLVSHIPPLVIGPQQFITVNLWFPANAATAMTAACDFGGWER